jgi:hypothetical protein
VGAGRQFMLGSSYRFDGVLMGFVDCGVGSVLLLKQFLLVFDLLDLHKNNKWTTQILLSSS